MRKDFRRKKRAGGKLDTPYIGPYLITKCHSKGMYRLQLDGDMTSTIERISSAYFKTCKDQHGCIETSARHVYVSNIVPTETFSTEIMVPLQQQRILNKKTHNCARIRMN